MAKNRLQVPFLLQLLVSSGSDASIQCKSEFARHSGSEATIFISRYISRFNGLKVAIGYIRSLGASFWGRHAY